MSTQNDESAIFISISVAGNCWKCCSDFCHCTENIQQAGWQTPWATTTVVLSSWPCHHLAVGLQTSTGGQRVTGRTSVTVDGVDSHLSRCRGWWRCVGRWWACHHGRDQSTAFCSHWLGRLRRDCGWLEKQRGRITRSDCSWGGKWVTPFVSPLTLLRTHTHCGFLCYRCRSGITWGKM